MKIYMMLYQLITMANANIMHSVEHWFKHEQEQLAEHFINMIRYYEGLGELTTYQANKLTNLARDLVENYKTE